MDGAAASPVNKRIVLFIREGTMHKETKQAVVRASIMFPAGIRNCYHTKTDTD